jgi:hypothetical protein
MRPDEFELVADELGRPLARFLGQMIPDRALAEDVLQETLCVAWHISGTAPKLMRRNDNARLRRSARPTSGRRGGRRYAAHAAVTGRSPAEDERQAFARQRLAALSIYWRALPRRVVPLPAIPSIRTRRVTASRHRGGLTSV